MALVAHLQAISHRYGVEPDVVRALRDIHLSVHEGDMIALWGPSGSGKTTLLNVLGCLERPTSGAYELGGRRVDQLPRPTLAALRAREIGFVFQSFNLIPTLSAWENVELPLWCDGSLTAGERRRRVDELVDAMGLREHAGRRPDQLSGGQKQRVAISRALVARPRLVLADEPTASLDFDTAAQVLALLAELNRTQRVTVVLSTHDPRVLPYVRREIELRSGEITADRAVDTAHPKGVAMLRPAS